MILYIMYTYISDVDMKTGRKILPQNLPFVRIRQVERVDPTVTSNVAKALKRKLGPSSWDGQVPWERGSMKLVDVGFDVFEKIF